MNCLQVREQMPAFVYGDLEREETQAVETHVQDCSSCRKEAASLHKLRDRLNSVSGPEVKVDFSRLYWEAARKAEGKARRQRWLTISFVGVAAAVVLTVLLSRLEIRLEKEQMVVRWGNPPVEKVVKTAPEPQPVAPEANKVTEAMTAMEERLRLLTDTVLAQSEAVDARDGERQREICLVAQKMQEWQARTQQNLKAARNDIDAIYAAQFVLTRKGEKP